MSPTPASQSDAVK